MRRCLRSLSLACPPLFSFLPVDLVEEALPYEGKVAVIARLNERGGETSKNPGAMGKYYSSSAAHARQRQPLGECRCIRKHSRFDLIPRSLGLIGREGARVYPRHSVGESALDLPVKSL